MHARACVRWSNSFKRDKQKALKMLNDEAKRIDEAVAEEWRATDEGERFVSADGIGMPMTGMVAGKLIRHAASLKEKGKTGT